MDTTYIPQILMIPEKELELIKNSQIRILEKLEELNSVTTSRSPYITASEYMDLLRIKRSKFDDLVQTNKIKTIKKGRKIYVLATEVERYFKDPTIK